MAPGESHPEFVSEQIVPKRGSFCADQMGRGLAGLPAEFAWREKRYRVEGVLATWKASGAEVGRPTGERYLRRHYFRVRTTSGRVMVLYCERNVRNRSRPKARWWLYTVEGQAMNGATLRDTSG